MKKAWSWRFISVYIGGLFLAVLVTQFFHELGHFVTGTFLGNQMDMTLNSSNPVSGKYLESWHRTLTTAVGPLFTFYKQLSHCSSFIN